MKAFLLLALFCTAKLCSLEPSTSLRTLYSSLDPLSLSQHLAFYELYPESEEGKKALSHAWKLLHPGKALEEGSPLPLLQCDISSLISLVTKDNHAFNSDLDLEALALIEKISLTVLKHHHLKGSQVWTEADTIALAPQDIDLGRGLLLAELDKETDKREKIRQYEANLDLMALQVLARLPINATPQQKIREINRFIFQEMQFRFPPHSIHAKDIDLYTFLPSVLDSRQGVCLGVSILYLCLAQRLDLPLEIVTPPGHIFIRYREKEETINIETTARGINIPTNQYLGINTRFLPQRNIKEVIGMAFMNHAAVSISKGNYQQTVASYEKALPYLPNDPLLNMFLGFSYVFVGKKREGEKYLKPLVNYTFDYAVSPESLPTDYLNGHIDIAGIKAIFLPVDENRSSIINKQNELKKTLARYPKFRMGLMQLATTYLQLGRGAEALQVLMRYHKVDPNDATVAYYLSAICIERMDYNRAWQFLHEAEALVAKRNHSPPSLKEIRHHIRRLCPEETPNAKSSPKEKIG